MPIDIIHTVLDTGDDLDHDLDYCLDGNGPSSSENKVAEDGCMSMDIQPDSCHLIQILLFIFTLY